MTARWIQVGQSNTGQPVFALLFDHQIVEWLKQQDASKR
jgi:hypothetical protein